MFFDGSYFDRLDKRYLSETDLLVRDMVRQFVVKEILPKVADWETGKFEPYSSQEELIKNLMKRFGELGLLGTNLNLQKYIPGFEKASVYSYGVIMRELEAGDSTVRSCVSVQSALTMSAIFKYGSEAQKEKWLPLLAAGEKIGAFALTEPQGGSDPKRMLTRAKIKDDHFVLNGAKSWITNGSIADVVVVWAVIDGNEIRGFLVELPAEGFFASDERKWAFKAGISSSLNFNGCRIFKENILPGTVIGLRSALSCLNEARFGINWGVIGAARRCFENALDFARERELFGEKLVQKQLVQKKLAEMYSLIRLSQLLVYDLSKLKDENNSEIDFYETSFGKYNNVASAVRVAELAHEIRSADVFTEEDEVGRHLRNLRIVRKYEGDHDVQELIVGAAITGEKAY
ncbi:MAG: acyl-CoA dehydrogenase family protein [Patescibacteria group bacterium]